MKKNQSVNKKQTPKPQLKQKNTRNKYFIQMLDIKRDTNMTRIYLAMQSVQNF